mmetsp:Transcript_22952/g.64493  ORF Transcript_22952/g.64493 Transcript_22952/m.64493 type:complete len:258 (+) Transcript_22952:144-917(+)|eukprot:CAMPEP_0119144818 /NCGR_PEP_ID=MMETSP1310-20130426/36523_1 /TAXON_ID=464262 /ORGANISM="Genus nov. species nov., Strain RCC2339" /LENGTH=257 /DNA_ID=CAMNT_0007136595 /DNA_START=40 /DNA_END=813 /DNA_ORIENTATION=-
MDHAIAGAVLVGWPVHDAVLMWPPLIRAYEDGDEEEMNKARFRAYLMSIGMPWATLAGLAYAVHKGVLNRSDLLLNTKVLPDPVSWRTLLPLGVCVLGSLDTATPLVLSLAKEGPTPGSENVEEVAFKAYFPSTPEQLVGWAGVSVTAGISEEVLFRGFLPFYLRKHLALSPAASYGVSTALFGAVHLYARESSDASFASNWKGALGSAAIGGIFSWVAYETNSILVPIVCHAFIDMCAGAFAFNVRRKAERKYEQI